MKPAPFEYFAPSTIDEALELAAQYGDEQKILAGGQSLVPMMNMRLARPENLIDINRIPALDGMSVSGSRLTLGALTRQATIEHSAVVRSAAPLLSQAVPYIAHAQIRGRGTVAGTLAHADPSAETGTVWLALDGGLTVRSTRGERRIAAIDFFYTVFTTALEDDEIIVSVDFAVQPPNAGYGFQEVARRHGDFAMVAAATVLVVEAGIITDARVALASVSDTPIRVAAVETALIGSPPDDEMFARAAEMVRAEVSPTADIHASADYRREVAGVLTRRALDEARDRLATR